MFVLEVKHRTHTRLLRCYHDGFYELMEDLEYSNEEVPVLVGYEGSLDGQRWMLHENLLIGRDPSCDVPILNRQVSRRHALLTRASEGVLLEDLSPKNGTHRNGKAVTGPALLKDGDIIQIA